MDKGKEKAHRDEVKETKETKENEEAKEIEEKIKKMSAEFLFLAKQEAMIIFDSLLTISKHPTKKNQAEKMIMGFMNDTPWSTRLGLAYFTEYQHKNKNQFSQELEKLINICIKISPDADTLSTL
jgi:hypothetical protein